MRTNIKYHCLVVPDKLRCEIRISVDSVRRPEYTSSLNENQYTNIRLFPMLTISIIRPYQTDENGNRIQTPWNVNDSLGLNTFHFPLFVNKLESIQKHMSTKDLYVYIGNRLELDEKKAEEIREVFSIGNVTIEFAPVVIEQPDETKVEGVKITFNNKDSSVALTLNELDALVFTLQHLSMDTIAFLLYLNYGKNPKVTDYTESTLTKVDILPKTS